MTWRSIKDTILYQNVIYIPELKLDLFFSDNKIRVNRGAYKVCTDLMKYVSKVTFEIRRIAIVDLEPNIECRSGLIIWNRIRTHSSQLTNRIHRHMSNLTRVRQECGSRCAIPILNFNLKVQDKITSFVWKQIPCS